MSKLAKGNGEKGKPVAYELQSLSKNTVAGLQCISESTSSHIGQVFDKLRKKKELFLHKWAEIELVSDVLDADIVSKFERFKDDIERAEAELKETLKSALVGVRSKKLKEKEAISSELDEFEKSSPCWNVDDFIVEHLPKEKINFYLHLRELGVPFLEKADNLEAAIGRASNDDLYVLLTNSDAGSAKQRNLFLTYKKHKAPSAEYLIVDFDLHPTLRSSSSKVSMYRSSEMFFDDCSQDDHRFDCLVKAIDSAAHKPSTTKESKPLLIRCPKALESDSVDSIGGTACSNRKVAWRCAGCSKEVGVVTKRKWGFLWKVYYVVCDCGSLETGQCGFKCNDPAHGDEYVPGGKDFNSSIEGILLPSQEGANESE